MIPFASLNPKPLTLNPNLLLLQNVFCRLDHWRGRGLEKFLLQEAEIDNELGVLCVCVCVCVCDYA